MTFWIEFKFQQKYQRLAATIVKEELELVAPLLPINRHRERAAKFEQSERDSKENKREENKRVAAMAAAIAAAASMGVE